MSRDTEGSSSRGAASARLAAVTAASLVAGILAGCQLVTQLRAEGQVVSQKGRAFHPETVILARGEAVTIINDDNDLLHHLYVDSDTFKFDSGDQAPGSRTAIAFPEKGLFKVLCAIHPKMKLFVRVN
ncbi:plastocyanin [Methylobacterium sp. sgz302541]|uniref:plastocyanin n=1 Tax=unclassified Methylobacterium TaxID=2615210 RepID=UPI003D3295E9